MAQVFNGYIYHTNYDLIDVIPRGAFQNTGDNILSIIRGLANATELQDTAVYNLLHITIFWFFYEFFYTIICRHTSPRMLSSMTFWESTSYTILRQLVNY